MTAPTFATALSREVCSSMNQVPSRSAACQARSLAGASDSLISVDSSGPSPDGFATREYDGDAVTFRGYLG